MATNNKQPGTMYDLSSVLDVADLESVRPGTNLLISGPAMTGKQDLAYDFLADGVSRGEGAVVVSTGDRAETIIEDFSNRTTIEEYNLGIVDCAADQSSAESRPQDGLFVHHVSSPGDITGIGIGLTEALEALHDQGVESGRLALSSLSPMLTYTDRKTVFKFCHVVSSRLDAADYLGLFTIDASAHDEQTLQVIKQAFDGMIEIREQDGGRQAQVRGLGGNSSDWIDL
jgi:KaiC/GvpD/RAD55 family RecA-like ATPase